MATESKNDRILTAAFGLFHQHGFRKVTMSDIAEAADMSRPTLYAVFPSKEAVFGGLALRQLERCEEELAVKLPKAKTLEAQLDVVFEIWIVEPFASIIDTANGLDLLGNAAVYAPGPCGEIYERFEHHLVTLLAPPMKAKKKGRMTARDLAHIMTLATKGLKATTTSLAELKRLTDGLQAMAIATAT